MELATLAETKAILGRNFHGPDETNLWFNTDLKIDGNWLVPWTMAILEKCRKECVLVVGCDTDRDGNPITINQMKKRWPGLFQIDFAYHYVSEPFRTATTPVRARPYLLHKRIPDTRNISDHIIQLHPSRKPMKNLEKISLLQPHEQLETAVVHVFAALLHYFTTHETMYPYDYILCADATTDKSRPRIGYFNGHKMYASCALPEITQYLGLAPGIRPDIMLSPSII